MELSRVSFRLISTRNIFRKFVFKISLRLNIRNSRVVYEHYELLKSGNVQKLLI